MSCVTDDSLLRNELGELTANQAAALQAHVATCSRCREKQAEIQTTVGDVVQVATAKPGMADAEFAARVGRAIRAPETSQPAKRGLPWPVWAAAAVVALLPAMFFLRSYGPLRGNDVGTFTARGGEARPAKAEALLVRDGKLLPLEGQRLRATDAMAVRVKNQGMRSIHVLAFAQDRAGEVHWLYPAYRDGAENPYAVEIPAGANTHLLPDLVTPESPAAGPMVVMTVLLDRPITVKEVEARLAKSADPALAFPGGVVNQWSISMESSR